MMVRMSLIYLAGRYGASAITLIALSFYTRLANPSEYGLYALVMAFASALYAAFGQWLRHVLLRFATDALDGSAPLPSLILRGFVGVAVVVGLVTFLSFSFLSNDVQNILLFALPLFAIMGSFELALAWLQLSLKPAFYVGVSILRTSLAAGLGLLALALGFGAAGLIYATIFAYGVAAASIFIKTGFGLGRVRLEVTKLKPMLSYGWPLALSATLGSALALADRALIAALISTEAAGLYAAPYDLAMRTLQVLMLAINLAGTPLIIRAFESGDADTTDALLTRQWSLLIGAGLPVTLGMALIPKGLSTILLGADFRQAGSDLMPLVAIATFLQGLESFYLSFAFALTKKPLRQTIILLVATLINIGLTLLLVPTFGILGGAWATVVSAGFVFIGSAFTGRSLHKLPFAPMTITRIALAGLAMAMFLIWRNPQSPMQVILVVPMAAMVYAASLIILNAGASRDRLRIALRARFSTTQSARETS